MYSLGVVFEPSRNFSASVDYFSINREGTVQILTLRQLVDNFQLFPERFIRDAGGRLTDIDQRWINAGGTQTEGFEFVVRGGLDVGNGRFNAGLDGTLLTKRSEQLIAGGPIEDRLGVFSFSGELGLRWKHNLFVGYTADDWNFTLTQLYRDGYTNQRLPGIANGSVTRPNLVDEVEPYIVYNAQVTFTGIENMRFGFGVKNLFDTDPPFSITYDSFTGGGSSWDPRVADPRGRSYTFLVELRF
jgi:iron complex outermembrane receptor protein